MTLVGDYAERGVKIPACPYITITKAEQQEILEETTKYLKPS